MTIDSLWIIALLNPSDEPASPIVQRLGFRCIEKAEPMPSGEFVATLNRRELADLNCDPIKFIETQDPIFRLKAYWEEQYWDVSRIE